MDLTTYSGLQAAVDHYLMDYGLDPVDLGTLVQTGADETYRRVRTFGMEEYVGSVQLGPGGAITPLPSRYIAMKAFRMLYHNGRMLPATRQTPEWFFENVHIDGGNVKLYFCRDGNRILAGAAEGRDVEYVYYKRPESFTVVPTNWFTQNAGDVLLWAALANSAPFVRQDERIPVWQQKWLQGVDALNGENLEEEGSGSSLEMGLG